MLLSTKNSVNQLITYQPEGGESITITIKREDLLHPFISGNKYRKLRYNVEEAHKLEHRTLLTFGGAYSNHIAATAFAAYELGFNSIGIIRGEELQHEPQHIAENPTLTFAQNHRMKLHFVSREAYRHKEEPQFIAQLHQKFGRFYVVPQGGTNELAVKGCEEILISTDATFDYICCAMGTGGTLSGIVNAAFPHQKVIGFPAVRDASLADVVTRFTPNKQNYTFIKDYDFGGFAKINEKLVRFMNDFKAQTQVALDPIYTGKMLYGIVDLHKNGFFTSSSKILVIHSGGLQGVEGMNQKLIQKKLPVLL